MGASPSLRLSYTERGLGEGRWWWGDGGGGAAAARAGSSGGTAACAGSIGAEKIRRRENVLLLRKADGGGAQMHGARRPFTPTRSLPLPARAVLPRSNHLTAVGGCCVCLCVCRCTVYRHRRHRGMPTQGDRACGTEVMTTVHAALVSVNVCKFCKNLVPADGSDRRCTVRGAGQRWEFTVGGLCTRGTN